MFAAGPPPRVSWSPSPTSPTRTDTNLRGLTSPKMFSPSTLHFSEVSTSSPELTASQSNLPVLPFLFVKSFYWNKIFIVWIALLNFFSIWWLIAVKLVYNSITFLFGLLYPTIPRKNAKSSFRKELETKEH